MNIVFFGGRERSDRHDRGHDPDCGIVEEFRQVVGQVQCSCFDGLVPSFAGNDGPAAGACEPRGKGCPGSN